MPVTRSKSNPPAPPSQNGVIKSPKKRLPISCADEISKQRKISKISVDVNNHKLKVVFQNDSKPKTNTIENGSVTEDYDKENAKEMNGHVELINQEMDNSSSSTLSECDESDTESDDNIADQIEADSDKLLNAFSKINLDNEDKSGISDYYFFRKHNRKTDSDKFFEAFESLNLDEQSFTTAVQNEYEQIIKEFQINLKPDMRLHYEMLRNNFNLIIYGYGSKIKILNHFIEEFLRRNQHFYIVVRGYLPEISLKDILIILNRALGFGIDSMITNHEELFENLREKFKDNDLFLVIHSVDRLIMQDRKYVMKNFLVKLLNNLPGIRFISSADVVNFEMQWTTAEMNELRLQMIPMNTYAPYLTERMAINGGQAMTSRLKSFQTSINYSSVCYVYESLNENAKRIFVIILKYFIENNNNKSSRTTLKFEELYQICREEFLTSSVATIRQQLTEFKDHKLLRFKSGIDGREYISICFDLDVAKKFYNSIQDL